MVALGDKISAWQGGKRIDMVKDIGEAEVWLHFISVDKGGVKE